MALTDKLSAIGDAIRAKTGKTDLIPLDQMPAEIASIQGGDSIIKTVKGTCPITLEDCVEGKLLDYKIYGAESGVGNKTKNLCSGVFNVTTKFDEPIPAGTKISVSAGVKGYDASDTTKRLRVRFFAADGTQIVNMYPVLDESGERIRFDNLSYAKDIYSYWLSVLDVGDYQIEIGEKHTEYEPYGYSVGIKVNENSPQKAYIGNAKLSYDDYIDFENRMVVIDGVETLTKLPDIYLQNGMNIIDVDTAVKPSKMSVSFVGK